MAHREFRGTDGREWAVWSVQPEYAERRKGDNPASREGAVERRGHDEYRVPLANRFVHGWLCFETKGEKRRLAPFPVSWAELDDRELRALCDSATRVEHAARRLVE
jgi:hypothetical protein